MCELLSHFPIADHKEYDSPFFETEVFLFALTSIAFPNEAEELLEIVKGPVILYGNEDDTGIRHRLSLYAKAADGDVMPCGFWSIRPINQLLTSPALRAFAMFGDFLACPESPEKYTYYTWPLFKAPDMVVFSRIFTTRVLEEVRNYIAAIAAVVKEEG